MVIAKDKKVAPVENIRIFRIFKRKVMNKQKHFFTKTLRRCIRVIGSFQAEKDNA